jgi:hypothetical protein
VQNRVRETWTSRPSNTATLDTSLRASPTEADYSKDTSSIATAGSVLPFQISDDKEPILLSSVSNSSGKAVVIDMEDSQINI